MLVGIGIWLRSIGGASGPVVASHILTEASDTITTEAGDGLITE